ncbi:EamA family transporter RarD [Altererythrobacter sp. MF3-039]|uniref:EamA family transporter RarD n=1 Tax=Altererythrobacter sp. MF3-039 TaxID=3252901 RepID=UPI00390CAF9B
MSEQCPDSAPSGLPHALGAYLIWGFLPLYLILVSEVPPFEFVGWRILWTVPFCFLIVALRRQWSEIRFAFTDGKALVTLVASASLIGLNWFIYIWAIQSGHVYAASIGYYLNPLLNVLLGTWLLGETLTRRQWLAVSVAAAGVALLLGGALTSLWMSLSLAITFGLYGLLRKQVSVGSLPGLTVESVLLTPISLAIVWWYARQPQGSSFGKDMELSFLIVIGGVVTAFPLLLFAIAARRMDYSVIGFIQFLAPTIVFILGLTVFKQELQPAQLGSFILIWIAIALFISDLFARSRVA